jgi:methylmalonyl-CoA mutase
MPPDPPIADEFPTFSKEDWRSLVLLTIGDRTFDDLIAHSDDDIPIGPVYGQKSAGAVLSRSSNAPWAIVQRIDHTDVDAARGQLRADLAGGADAVDLVLATSPSAHGAGLPPPSEATLAGLFLDVWPGRIRIDAGESSDSVAALVSDLAAGGSVAIDLAFDPIATLAAAGHLDQRVDNIIGSLVTGFRVRQAAGISGAAVTADGRLWHAGGASDAQELAAVLAAHLAYLRRFEAEGIAPENTLDSIGIALAADADQFLTIAKFRAARLLVARVMEEAGIAFRPCRIHAETAWRMMSRRDPHANILRTTIAAFSAGVGGADSVTVLPFDAVSGIASAHARRLARNTQTVLMDEANLARVADASAGSGAIEALTAALAETAWERFRLIEAEGGLLASLRAGSLQRDIGAVREARLTRVATRKIELTGVSAYPDLGERSEPRIPSRESRRSPAAIETVEPLTVIRLAQSFEDLRDRADALAMAGTPPRVLVVGLGRASDFAAFVADAKNLFAAGGIAAIEIAGPTSLEAPGATATPIACICAGSAVPDADIAQLASALRDRGAARILLIGSGHDPAQAAIDDFLVDGLNALALLGKVLDTIAA